LVCTFNKIEVASAIPSSPRLSKIADTCSTWLHATLISRPNLLLIKASADSFDAELIWRNADVSCSPR
jgi:hypothetical protein